jgi:hypothetical protein
MDGNLCFALLRELKYFLDGITALWQVFAGAA